MTDLVEIARSLVAGGKGILAIDESVPTATKRLALYGVAAGEEMRAAFRDLFLGAPGIEEYLSGAILFSETFAQKGSDRKLFPNSLAARGIAPGIKVDEGIEALSNSPHEVITKGLIGLPERLAEYKKKGAVFTKWRAVIHIDGALPTSGAIHENAGRLATYAKEAQAAGMVPILEPEILLEGTHSRTRAQEVIEQTLTTLFSMIEQHSIDRASLIVKTSMALSGADSKKKDTPEEVAESTLDALMKSVPKQVAGIVFLSGGQSPDQATANLAAIVKLAREKNAPWPLTFSFARALQDEALEIWRGHEENIDAARAAFLARLAKVAAAAHI